MMNIGCSLCGWNDLKVYANHNVFYEFAYTVLSETGIVCYEIPYVPQLEYNFKFCESFLDKVYSIHASKYIFERDFDTIVEYFTKLKHYCNILNCKNIVVHPPPIGSEYKLELALKATSGICISIETVTNNAFIVYHQYAKYCKMTIDISHLLYLEQQDMFYGLLHDEISHFHVRGYSKNVRYVSLDKNNTKQLTVFLQNIHKHYSQPYIIEYPFTSIDELRLDIKKLKFITQERGE